MRLEGKLQVRQLGFGLGLHGSLSDLLVPLAIMAILGWIGVTNYFDYQARTRVTEAIASVAPARAAIEKAFAARGPADMSQSAVTGWNPPAGNEHVQPAAVGKDGTITLRFSGSVAPPGENELRIVPVSDGKALDLSLPANAGRKFEWQCGGPAGKTTLPRNYRPENCR